MILRKTLLGRAMLGAMLGAALAAPVHAETANPLKLTAYAKLERAVVDDQGNRQIERVDPETVVPGDRLVLGTHYANGGDRGIANFVVSNPVPAAVKVADDVSPALLVSVDGGQTWGRLAELAVTGADGQRRAAQPGDISHVRWIIPELAPGQSGQVEFPVTVR